MELAWTFSAVATAALLIACGDDSTRDAATTTSSGDASGSSGGGEGGTTSGAGGSSSVSTGNGGTGTGGGAALSFENDIWPILSMPRNPPLSGSADSCAGTNGCHLGGAGGLVLPDAMTAYANLIGQPSSSALCTGLLEVVASEPDQSCFVVFYEQRLRDQLGWVEQAETDIVRSWVEQGAAP